MLLKLQAQERKNFYSERAKASNELREKHAKEREDLVARHRAARHKLEEEKPIRSERAFFFRIQRSDMTALEAHQRDDVAGIDTDLERKLRDFHMRQRKTRDALTASLSKNQPRAALR